jgi:hypothetical protein
MKIASLAKLHVNNINVELKYNVAKGLHSLSRRFNRNGQDKEFEYNFPVVCRNWNLIKNSEDNFKANVKLTSCYSIKTLSRL